MKKKVMVVGGRGYVGQELLPLLNHHPDLEIRAVGSRMLAGEPPPEEQQPSMGCNIKWKAGNAPSYFPAS